MCVEFSKPNESKYGGCVGASFARLDRIAIASLLLLLTIISEVSSHGAVVDPPPRNAIDNDIPPWSGNVPNPIPGVDAWCPVALDSTLESTLSGMNGQACFWFIGKMSNEIASGHWNRFVITSIEWCQNQSVGMTIWKSDSYNGGFRVFSQQRKPWSGFIRSAGC